MRVGQTKQKDDIKRVSHPSLVINLVLAIMSSEGTQEQGQTNNNNNIILVSLLQCMSFSPSGFWWFVKLCDSVTVIE